MAQHPVAFGDLGRGLRALVFGTAVMVVGLLAQLHPAEALTLSILFAMLVDLLRMVQASLRLDAQRTREVFSTWQPNGRRLLRRTVFLAFLSVLVLSFCVHDVHSTQSVLPQDWRTLIYFASLFGSWLQMHNGFAIFYAKKYFRLNPLPSADGPNPQGFVFAGSDEPEFTDFLYVAYAVGLTYAMSDTNLEDSSIRRVVLFHSVVSFLFYSTVISAVINLFTSG